MLGFDSLERMELALKIEERFGFPTASPAPWGSCGPGSRPDDREHRREARQRRRSGRKGRQPAGPARGPGDSIAEASYVRWLARTTWPSPTR